METFLALDDEWLPYRLWAVAGKKKLYERALKHGTPAEWADLLGLQLRSRSQRTAREREARVERELRRLLREYRFESMPSLAILKDIGGSSLAVDVELSGGVARWAWRLWVPITSQGVARTKARTEQELRFLLRGRTTWPSRREFELMGQQKLLQAVYRGKGSVWWARRLGLKHPSARRRKPKVADELGSWRRMVKGGGVCQGGETGTRSEAG